MDFSEWEQRVQEKVQQIEPFKVCGGTYRMGFCANDVVWTFFAVEVRMQRIEAIVHVDKAELGSLSIVGLGWIVASASEEAESQIRDGNLRISLEDMNWSSE
jgi:hypothetical protein